MIIIRLTENQETLDDIERVCRHLADLIPLMTIDDTHDISYILRPTLSADHNEAEKKSHWQKLLNEFVLMDKKGNELRFFRDEETQGLYFGDEKGFYEIGNINHHNAIAEKLIIHYSQ